MAMSDFVKDGQKHARDFLNFNFSENPPWHKGRSEDARSPEDLIGEICELKRRYGSDHIREDIVRQFRDDFIVQMSYDEEVGLQSREDIKAVTNDIDTDYQQTENIKQKMTSSASKSQMDSTQYLETKNMLKTWRYFENSKIQNAGAVLTPDIVARGHEILMKGLIPNPGELSDKDRITECPVDGREVKYPSPSFVLEVYLSLLDYANYIACYLKDRLERNGIEEEIVRDIIKFCAWFFYSFVSLHPFSDGNGRMSRLLYFYIQSIFSPFPVGIYNIYSPTKKMDYYEAIYQVREENRRCLQDEESIYRENNWTFRSKPSDLATMILECQWHTWKELESKSQSLTKYDRQLSKEILNPESLEDYYDSNDFKDD